MKKRIYNATVIEGGSAKKLKVILRDNDTLCKPNFREDPYQKGFYPHLLTDKHIDHFDEISPENKVGYKADVGTISGTCFMLSGSGTVSIYFPYQNCTAFSTETDCIVTLTQSGNEVIISGSPAGNYYLTGFGSLE